MDTAVVAKKPGLTGTQIKTIAILAMLIDHIAWSFVHTYTVPGQLMHVIGRLTAPIMCYFIAQGYIHTRSFKKYLLRMGIFALIAHIPYVLESNERITFFPFSVMYTLTLGLVAIYAYDKIKNKVLRWLAIIVIGILAMPGDWLFFGIAFCLIFYIYRDNFKKQCIGIICVGLSEVLLATIASAVVGRDIMTAVLQNLFQLSIIFSLPILYLYNGKRGGGGKFSRWGFYIFYPLHLLIIALIKIFLL
jgi:hypothetical protein